MRLPSSADLESLRKGLRKRKLPKIVSGMWASEPGTGGVKFSSTGTDFKVEWVIFVDGIKSEPREATWRDLCLDSALELQRLEVGFVFCELIKIHAQKIMSSIGHPIAAFKEAKPLLDEAERWRHWAIVPAGHMLGIH